MRKILISLTLFFGTLVYAKEATYDPIKIDDSQTIKTLDLTI